MWYAKMSLSIERKLDMNFKFKVLIMSLLAAVGLSGCYYTSVGVAYYDPYFNPYYDSYCYYNFCNYYYDSWGNIIYYSTSSTGRGRDVVGDVAKQEEKELNQAAESLVARYSLSSEKAVQVARVLKDWNQLSGRARTEADYAEFSERLYGMKFSALQSAVVSAYEGDSQSLKSVVAQVAQNWGTSEETMRDVLTQWYGEQFSALYYK
jgi:hypothetical protein